MEVINAGSTLKSDWITQKETKFDWIEIFGFRVDLEPSGKITPIDQGETTKLIFNSPINATPQIVGITSKVVYNGR